jgi:phosphoribosyl 1,2-cyclic phosphodiesterase
MRMTVLASGSKGNSTVIASARTRVLVDAGLSCRELLRRMEMASEDAAKLDAILITHEHVDHVAGLQVLARRLGIPVYFTEATHRAWVRMLTPKSTMTYAKWLEQLQAKKLGGPQDDNGNSGNVEQEPRRESVELAASGDEEMQLPVEEYVEPAHRNETAINVAPSAKADPAALPKVEYFRAGCGFTIGDLAIEPFTIPHDAADPCGFVFESEGIRMAVATDLGYVPANVKAALKRIDAMLLESNHDLEMLRDGPYPWSVKQRVLSRVGHLSNAAAAEFLERDYDGGAAYIVLGHLSESNNAPELARLAAERAIGGRMPLLGNRVVLAMQSEPLPAICL